MYPRRVKLEARDCVHVSQNDRDRWVEQVVKEVGPSGIFYTMSGDSLVIAFAEDGVVEVLDCLVRRSGLDRVQPGPPVESVWERLLREESGP